MPGRPKRRAALDKLWTMTRDAYADPDTGECDATPLDYACDFIASNTGNLSDLGARCGVSREVIRSILHDFPDAKQRLVEARKELAHVLIETTEEELTDRFDLIQTDLQLKKVQARASLRQFQAQAYNREVFAPKTAPDVNVNVNNNFASLFLDALRDKSREVHSIAPAAPTPLLGAGDGTHDGDVQGQ